jgi:hypothetical protein
MIVKCTVDCPVCGGFLFRPIEKQLNLFINGPSASDVSSDRVFRRLDSLRYKARQFAVC